ncbi:MAG: porin [Planctomycetota bacterium]|jgi:hypothetical protein
MTDKLKTRTYSLLSAWLVLGVVVLLGMPTTAAESNNDLEATRREVEELKATVGELGAEIRELKNAESGESSLSGLDSALGGLNFGGYGEVHANFTEGAEKDKVDFHRLVLYIGYDFADWIKFHSETELEHAFVNDGDGEISVEQAYLDFLLTGDFNIRAGRILTPIGIINKKHEPPTFNGVERPNFAKYIIPTTWSSDGVGIFGSINPALTYEAYVVGGLDGSKFDATNGIRKGRIKERPSLNEPAVTGRLDYYPAWTIHPNADESLRLGVSGYFGGLDNGDEGKNPGIDGEIGITSADFEYSVQKLDFRGVIAHINIDGARQIGNNVAEEIFGWYLEGAYHYWPEEWKTGKLAKSDATVFLRCENYDTQYEMPSRVSRNGAGNRRDWTLGTNVYLTPKLVVKADYQIRDDHGPRDLDDLLNLGIGWSF